MSLAKPPPSSLVPSRAPGAARRTFLVASALVLGCRTTPTSKEDTRAPHPRDSAPALGGPAASVGPAQPPAARPHRADDDPSVLVVTHSWSGRTARLGGELAAMLGASHVAFHDAPIPDAPVQPPSLADVAPNLSLRGVRTLFLGFPVWGEAPSPFVAKLVPTLALAGVRVVPFYSYLHEVQPAKLALLREQVTGRGGTVLPELAFLLPLTATNADLDRRARRELLARRDLWAPEGSSAEQSVASCAQRNPRDGAELCRVPSGLVWWGDASVDPPPGAEPPRRVRVPAFDIGRAEITVGQYAKCVAAGACGAIDFTQNFCGQLLADAAHRDALPVPCATYPVAERYCRWAGMRLPSEAEWQRAGRGETTQAFPWGDAPPAGSTEARGNFGEKRATGFPGYSTVPDALPWTSDGFRGLAPGCSFPAGRSPFGVCDLAGNLAEWVQTVPPFGDVVKGGSWLDAEPDALRLSTSVPLPSTLSRQIGLYLTGFRCAQAAP